MAYQTYNYEYTDTFAGEANYTWVKCGKVHVPELTHYGYDGSQGYSKASKSQMREVVKLVKSELGLTGVPCHREELGDTLTLTPRGYCTIIFISFAES